MSPSRTEIENDSDRVLAIASHVVFGYAGNSVTTFVLQSLSLEVSALNTVQFSNHTGYRQWTGYLTTAAQISDLWRGLKQIEIVQEYGMLLTGYIPGADEVEAVGKVARELKELRRASVAEGGRELLWVLDPVMGDQGRLYVSPDVVPVYKSLLPYSDLITPNQFETELLCGVKIDSPLTLALALAALHEKYNIPHIVITSVTYPPSPFTTTSASQQEMFCAGSTLTSTNSASRKFIVPVPVIPGTFVGTGDMFASLLLARFRQQAELTGLLDVKSWISPDDVPAEELPLARAVALVLASMHLVLKRTEKVRDAKLARMQAEEPPVNGADDCEKKMNVRRMRVSELQLVKSQRDLVCPGEDVVKGFRPLRMAVDTDKVN